MQRQTKQNKKTNPCMHPQAAHMHTCIYIQKLCAVLKWKNKGWRCDSSGRAPASQAQRLGFKSSCHKKRDDKNFVTPKGGS